MEQDTKTSNTWQKLRDLNLPVEGRMIAGVCVAFGNATPIPAWSWRAIFCTTLIFGGVGAIVYLILMICIPDSDNKKTP